MTTKGQELKKELTQAFPELKFSVKTKMVCKGNITEIVVTVKGLKDSDYTIVEIKEITNKYHNWDWRAVTGDTNVIVNADEETKKEIDSPVIETIQETLEPAPAHETLDDWTISLIPQSPIRTEVSTLSELVEELDKENKQLKESVKSLTFSRENDYQECLKYITSEKTRLDKCIKQLQEEYQELERKGEILWEKNRELEQNKEYGQTQVDNLKQRVHDLECTVYLLQRENKQLKGNQLEPKLETKPETKPTAKKRPKFKLPENFTDYQQECDDLINALSCFYNIKKGKWNENILQFILTPTDAQKENQLYPYPDKWKAGLYLQPGQWTIGKVNLADPDDWENWFLDIFIALISF